MKWSHHESRRAWESESWHSDIKMFGHASIKASIHKRESLYKAKIVITNT